MIKNVLYLISYENKKKIEEKKIITSKLSQGESQNNGEFTRFSITVKQLCIHHYTINFP